MSNNGKHSWFSSPASVIAIVTVLLNGMGFLTIRTFILRMCLPTNFFEDTPIDYFQWGAKAVVSLIIMCIQMAIIISLMAAILSFISRQTILRLKSVKGFLEKVILKFRTRIHEMNTSRLTAILFVLSFVTFLLYCTTQSPIIAEFIKDGCKSGQFDAPTIFSRSNNYSLQNYRFFSASQIIILSLMLFFSNKALARPGSQKIFPNLFTFAIFSLWLFSLAFWAMPYRLMSHNEFEAVRYSNEKAYVISEKNSRLFLYVPGKQPFVIEKNDTLLDLKGKRYYENIFGN